MGKRRSLAGNVGIGVFALSLLCTVIAFSSASWLVSDPRFTGEKFDRLGLWTHCFRSLPDPTDEYEKRFHVGCRWVYDPFTYGYRKIIDFLRPPFMIATQFFYTLTLIGVLGSFILVLLFFLCFGPENKYFIKLIFSIGVIMLSSGVCSVLAVTIFAICANQSDWMIGHDNNFFGWAFVVAIIGSIACLITGALFMVETTVQKKKEEYLKKSSSMEL